MQAPTHCRCPALSAAVLNQWAVKGPLRSFRRGWAYLNWNRALCSLLSSSLSVSVAHLPFQLLSVFHT
jgi:hypothetical protein